MKRIVIDLLVIFVIVFGLSCLIPWFDSKSGQKLPLGMIYVNTLQAFVWVKVAHLTTCIAVTVMGAWLYRHMRKPV
jgi:fluoride ion exporter CrcB/FEX